MEKMDYIIILGKSSLEIIWDYSKHPKRKNRVLEDNTLGTAYDMIRTFLIKKALGLIQISVPQFLT